MFSAVPAIQNFLPNTAQAIETVESVDKKAEKEKVKKNNKKTNKIHIKTSVPSNQSIRKENLKKSKIGAFVLPFIIIGGCLLCKGASSNGKETSEKKLPGKNLDNSTYEDKFKVLVDRFCLCEKRVQYSRSSFKTLKEDKRSRLKDFITNEWRNFEKGEFIENLKQRIFAISGEEDYDWDEISKFMSEEKNKSVILQMCNKFRSSVSDQLLTQTTEELNSIIFKTEEFTPIGAWKNYFDFDSCYEDGTITKEITKENITEEVIIQKNKELKEKYWNFYERESCNFLIDFVQYVGMYVKKKYDLNLNCNISDVGYNCINKIFVKEGENGLVNFLEPRVGKLSNGVEVTIQPPIIEFVSKVEKLEINDKALNDFTQILSQNFHKVKAIIDEQISECQQRGITEVHQVETEIAKFLCVPIKDSEYMSFLRYVDSSTKINAALRSGRIPDEDTVRIQSFLAKNKLKKNMVLFRYMPYNAVSKFIPQIGAFANPEDLIQKINNLNEKKRECSDKGFVSTTIERGLKDLLRFGTSDTRKEDNKPAEIEIKIIANKGTEGFYLPNMNEMSGPQKEFLLNAGQKFKIIGARKCEGSHAKVMIIMATLPKA